MTGNSTYSFVIEGEIPSKKNSHIRYAHGGLGPNKRYKEWEEATVWAFKGQKPPSKPLLKTTEVMITFYPKTRRKSDLTNKAESIMDALVSARILDDDNIFVVPRLVLEFGEISKENPRCEIEIW